MKHIEYLVSKYVKTIPNLFYEFFLDKYNLKRWSCNKLGVGSENLVGQTRLVTKNRESYKEIVKKNM